MWIKSEHRCGVFATPRSFASSDHSKAPENERGSISVQLNCTWQSRPSSMLFWSVPWRPTRFAAVTAQSGRRKQDFCLTIVDLIMVPSSDDKVYVLWRSHSLDYLEHPLCLRLLTLRPCSYRWQTFVELCLGCKIMDESPLAPHFLRQAPVLWDEWDEVVATLSRKVGIIYLVCQYSVLIFFVSSSLYRWLLSSRPNLKEPLVALKIYFIILAPPGRPDRIVRKPAILLLLS